MSAKHTAPDITGMALNTPRITNARKVTAMHRDAMQRASEAFVAALVGLAPRRRRAAARQLNEATAEHNLMRANLEREVRVANPDASEAQIQAATRSL